MLDVEIAELRSSRDAIYSAIEGLSLITKGKAVQCPWHDDQNPSASIIEKDGVWRLWCHACNRGGDVFDLREKATGKTVADQFRELKQSQDKSPRVDKKLQYFKTFAEMESSLTGLTKSYLYWNADRTKIDMAVFRLMRDGKKTFRQAHESADGWTLTAPPKPWPIYNLDRVKGADHVVIVEGEKDVQTLHAYGIVATTSPGGASNPANAEWSALSGRTVTIWPDMDDAGSRYADDVYRILSAIPSAPKVSRIDPQKLGLKEKQDVTDLVDTFDAKTKEEIQEILLAILDDAQDTGASVDYLKLLEDKISGRVRPVPFPWNAVSRVTRALLPGTVTLLCGTPGSGKSYMLLEAAAHWFGADVKIALYELEEDRTYHLDRSVAQRTGNALMLDHDWVMANPDTARRHFNENKEFINDFGARIFEAVTDQPTLSSLADWVEAQAKAGCRVIMIDPVSAAVASAQPWAEDLAFIMRIKGIAKKYSTSLILVMHPRKGNNKPGMSGLDDLAGGAAYQRFAQCVLWLERLPETIYEQVDGEQKQCTHMLKVLKTRNGSGAGRRIGFVFHTGTFRFREVGLVENKTKDETDTCATENRGVSSRWNKMDTAPNDSEDKLS